MDMQDEYIKAVTLFREFGEQTGHISELCKENVNILSDPLRMMMESNKIEENVRKIQIHLFTLNSFADVINKNDMTNNEKGE